MPWRYSEPVEGTVVLAFSGEVTPTDVRAALGRFVDRLQAAPARVVADLRSLESFDPTNHFVAVGIMRMHWRAIRKILVGGADLSARGACLAAGMLLRLDVKFADEMPAELAALEDAE